MANYQNNMRCSRRSIQPAQNAQTVCQTEWAAVRIHMIIFPPICRLPWLMFHGRNGRIFTNPATASKVELFLRNWINRFWEKEAYADE